jgi:hypothetical protein
MSARYSLAHFKDIVKVLPVLKCFLQKGIRASDRTGQVLFFGEFLWAAFREKLWVSLGSFVFSQTRRLGPSRLSPHTMGGYGGLEKKIRLRSLFEGCVYSLGPTRSSTNGGCSGTVLAPFQNSSNLKMKGLLNFGFPSPRTPAQLGKSLVFHGTAGHISREPGDQRLQTWMDRWPTQIQRATRGTDFIPGNLKHPRSRRR